MINYSKLKYEVLQKKVIFMRNILLVLIMLLAVCGRSESRSFPSASADDSNSVAVLTGETIVECLIEKFSASSGDDHVIKQFKHSVASLIGKRVIIRGYVSSVSQQFLSREKKVIVTVGRSAEQAVNVKFLVRGGAKNSVLELQAGQDVVFGGRISDSWDFLNDLVVEDAVAIDLKEYNKMSAIARKRRDFLLGDCLIRAKPFEELCQSRRSELLEMAKCANAAYPNKPIPSGYRPLAREEWETVVVKSHYSAEIYSDDGYVVFGDGLRGRVFISRFSGRVIVAWSGCDLSGSQIRAAGGLDFLTCVTHLLKSGTTSQFSQAFAITKGVVEYFKDDVWIVGHSLGGCITTYLAAQINDDPLGERIKFATFNGLGIASSMANEMGSERRNICARRLTNVYCTEDPVFNMHQFTRWTGIPPRHFGQSYFIKYRDPDNKIGAIDELLWCHGMDEMCCQIKYYCPKFTTWQICLIGLLIVILVLGCYGFLRVLGRHR